MKRYSALAAVLVLMVVGMAPGHSPSPSGLAPAIAAPVVTAAAINTTAITVTWSAVPGTVQNYTLMYARFYGLPIAYISAGTKLVYNVTDLGYGLTYYFTVWAWENGTEGPPSNVAAAQTDVPGTPAPPFPWQEIDAITMLSIVGTLAFSAVIAVLISGRRVKRAEGAAAVALARTRPRDQEAELRPRPGPQRRRS